MGLAVFVCCTSRADEAPAADHRLAAAYRSCHFSQQYPPEAVKEIQDKLQNVPRAVDVLAQLAKDSRHEIRLLTILLLAELGDPYGAKLLWLLLQDDVDSVRMAASGGLVQLRKRIVVPGDLTAIKDHRPEVRRLTVATLGKFGDKNQESTLIACLEDENEMVRAEAVRVLVDFSSKAVEQALLRRLQDQSADVRWITAKALGGYVGTEYNQQAISGLESVLKDPDWHVRAAAILSLGGHTSPVVNQEKFVIAIITVLESEDFALVRDRAADALAFTKASQMTDALVRALVSDDHSVRFHAARAMITGHCVAVLPQLMKYSTNSNAEVRERIMGVFGAIGGSDQLPLVGEATNDENSLVRLAAVDALQKIGARTGGATLLQKLSDTDPHVRAAVARALGHSGDKTVVPKLLPLLHDSKGYVRSAAAEALGKLGDRSAVPALIALLAGIETAPGDDSGLVVKTQNDLLADKLKFTEVEQKTAVAIALGELRANDGVDSLIKHGLKSDDLSLQAAAAYSLGHIGDRRAVNPLQDTVRTYYDVLARMDPSGFVIDDGKTRATDTKRRDREKEARVRAAVVWALGQIGDPAAQQMLKRARDDDNSLVRDNAEEAISKCQERQEREQQQVNEVSVPSQDKSRSATAAQTP